VKKTTPIALYLICILVIPIISWVGLTLYHAYTQNRQRALIESQAGMPYQTNIIVETEQNTNFRKVLFTGTRSQLVVMSIPAGGEVGEETHQYVEQTLFFLSGTGKAILDGKESPVNAGDVVVVTAGTKHNFINTGADPLKIYTVYAPANHLGGLTEATKADADKNVQDEAFGEEPK
jgi:mannose-6-phosphate isomerase-like protein (cupin superfamily)